MKSCNHVWRCLSLSMIKLAQLRVILTLSPREKKTSKYFKMILVHKGMITMGASVLRMQKVASSG